jgi:hypothetical protein
LLAKRSQLLCWPRGYACEKKDIDRQSERKQKQGNPSPGRQT